MLHWAQVDWIFSVFLLFPVDLGLFLGGCSLLVPGAGICWCLFLRVIWKYASLCVGGWCYPSFIRMKARVLDAGIFVRRKPRLGGCDCDCECHGKPTSANVCLFLLGLLFLVCRTGYAVCVFSGDVFGRRQEMSESGISMCTFRSRTAHGIGLPMFVCVTRKKMPASMPASLFLRVRKADTAPGRFLSPFFDTRDAHNSIFRIVETHGCSHYSVHKRCLHDR